jgi:hypothetical protein
MSLLRRLPPLVLLLAALGFVAGAALSGLLARSAAPTWQSTAILDIDQPRVVAAATDPAVLDKLSRLRFKYVGLVGTDRVATPVAQALDEEVGDVRPRLSAVAVPQDLLLRAVGTGGSRAEAERTANALAAALVQLVAKEQADDGIPPAQRVEVSLVDVAADATQIGPSSPSVALASMVGGLLVAGVVLAGVARRVARPA